MHVLRSHWNQHHTTLHCITLINVLLHFTATDFTFCFHTFWSNTLKTMPLNQTASTTYYYYIILLAHHCIGSHCVASVKLSSMNGKRTMFEGRVFSNAFCLYLFTTLGPKLTIAMHCIALRVGQTLIPLQDFLQKLLLASYIMYLATWVPEGREGGSQRWGPAAT